jgi:hypothetical protein
MQKNMRIQGNIIDCYEALQTAREMLKRKEIQENVRKCLKMLENARKCKKMQEKGKKMQVYREHQMELKEIFL